jgi:hypothetical protein
MNAWNNSHFLAKSSLERDFCRRRLARQKGPEEDVSAQRPEIGDHHTEKWPQKRPSCSQVLISRFRKTGWWSAAIHMHIARRLRHARAATSSSLLAPAARTCGR